MFLIGSARSYSYEWSGDEEEIIKAKDGPPHRVAMMERDAGNHFWDWHLAELLTVLSCNFIFFSPCLILFACCLDDGNF